MNVGFEVFNPNGVLLLDGTRRLARLKGATYLDASGASKSIATDLSDGVAFYSFQPDFLFEHINQNSPNPVVTITSSSISWTYSNAGGTSWRYPVSGWLFWGVF